MKKKHLQIDTKNIELPKNRIEDGILARWDKTILASDGGQDNVINILDVIGQDYWTGEGVTAKRISAALRSIGADNDVVVNVNSPGGDFFEGATIYNMLASHKGKVTVNVIGLAASAASVIAMAGDTIKISQVGFLMVHNVWSCVCGNRHDLAQVAQALEAFDGAMHELYSARTGLDTKDVAEIMDGETWLNAKDAIDKGFADEVINVKKAQGDDAQKHAKAQAKRTLEMALAKEGLSRKEREDVLQKAGLRDAASSVARDADNRTEDEEWQDVIRSMKS